MTTTHDLKLWPEFFDDVQSGKRSFELRKNDRGYQVGDVLLLREWEPNTATYSGRQISKRIVCKVDGIGTGGIVPLRGLAHGYCILGLADP